MLILKRWREITFASSMQSAGVLMIKDENKNICVDVLRKPSVIIFIIIPVIIIEFPKSLVAIVHCP